MKYSWSKILTSTILVVAYSIVIYKLLTYDNYTELFVQLKLHSSKNCQYIAYALLLFPLNIILESIKWKYAIYPIERVSLKKAIYATLIGQVGAIASPNKLGDIPTRSLILSKGNKTNATILGFISAWTLSIIIIIVGVIASFFYITKFNATSINKNYLISTCICCIVVLILLFSIPKISKLLTHKNNILIKIKNILSLTSTISSMQIINIIALSFLRFTIFCIQLYLMLHFFNIDISIYEAIISIPTIYLLTTITPSTIASEAATRSSYAIIVLAPICSDAPVITIATTLLWCINNGLPLILGLFLFNSKKVKI